METLVTIPMLSEDMTEGTITVWLVEEGAIFVYWSKPACWKRAARSAVGTTGPRQSCGVCARIQDRLSGSMNK